MTNKEIIVGISGYGYVGQAVHSIINIDPLIDDVKKNKSNNFIEQKKLLKCDIIFVCLPTPFTTEFDFSIIKEKLDFLVSNDYSGVVVIKSTCLSSYLEEYETKLSIVVNPEFLNQNSNFSDSISQKIIILGGSYANVKTVIDFYKSYTILENTEFEIMSIKEACDFKYTRNIYGAFKVLFWEFIQDTTGNSRKMAELYSKMQYQSEMSQVGMDGFRGFGGACFPKDVASYDVKHNHELTSFMIKYNRKLGEIQ